MASLQPDPNTLDRDAALYMAKLAEQAERYDDMVKYMRRIVDLKVPANELTVEERNLLSVGYKNMMSVRRTAWRTVQQYFEKNTEESSSENAAMDKAYSEHISKEVFKLIDEVRDEIVNVYVDGANKPVAAEESAEVIVFFRKMEGDYNRYGAEITEEGSAEKEKYKQASKAAYEAAQETAQELPSTNPIRLGLALNFSVFHYEVAPNPQCADFLGADL
jgi:14-3-3 protein epsilon